MNPHYFFIDSPHFPGYIGPIMQVRHKSVAMAMRQSGEPAA
jgi:hypothetical protein